MESIRDPCFFFFRPWVTQAIRLEYLSIHEWWILMVSFCRQIYWVLWIRHGIQPRVDIFCWKIEMQDLFAPRNVLEEMQRIFWSLNVLVTHRNFTFFLSFQVLTSPMASQDGSTSPRWHDLHRMCRFPQRTRGGSSNVGSGKETRPIASMYGIFAYIWLIFMVNV